MATVKFRERILNFLFAAGSDGWLALLRFGLGLQIVFYSLSLRGDWQALFAGEGSGFVSRDLTEAILKIENPFVPQIGWFVVLGSHAGIGEQTTLSILWALLFSAGCGLLLGLVCRPSAIIAWLLHLCAAKSGDFLTYGVDNLMTIGLFYLAIAPLPDRYALGSKLWKTKRIDPGRLGFHRRVLQLHLCIIYFFSGLTKCLGAGWWNGASIWRALTRPPFNIIPVELLVSWKILFPFLGVAVCVIETSYPIFIWWKKTRLVWLVSVLAMHIAIGLSMGLYLFSLIMVVLNVAAFGPGTWIMAPQWARSVLFENRRVEPRPSGAG
jgi:riboflavin transporter FmnP